MKKIIIFLVIATISCAISQIRPKEAWVFRSVLDKRARVITVALNKDLYVAYDGNNCGIYKIWKDGVKYSGTIWDTKHGPQPITNGSEYTYGLADEQVWYLVKDGKNIPTKVAFKGYLWKNNKVTFKYELSSENIKINVEETPEFIVNATTNQIGLERKFKTDAPSGYTIQSIIKYDNLSKKEDLVSDGVLKFISKNEQYRDRGITLTDIKSLFTLKNDGITTLTAYYSSTVSQ